MLHYKRSILLVVFILWHGLIPKQLYADTIHTLQYPFRNCETWYIWQGYSSGTHQNSTRYSFDLVKGSRSDANGSGGEIIVAAATGTFTNPFYIAGPNGENWGLGINQYLEDGTTIFYGHLMNIPQLQGIIQRGTPIGQVFDGHPGGVNHLHFQLKPTEPLVYGAWNYPANGSSDGNGTWSGAELIAPCNPLAGSITSPPPNSSVSGIVPIRGQITTPTNTIDRLEIYINNILRAQIGISGNTWQWDWLTSTYGNNQQHTIRVKAIEQSGQATWLRATNGSEDLIVRTANPTTPIPPQSNCLKPLLRYWSQDRLKHFYTSALSEIGTGNAIWVYEGFAGYVAATSSCFAPGAIPLYRFWSTSRNKHFYTTNYDEGINNGFELQRIEGYVLSGNNPAYNTIPIKRFYHPQLDNHFYTTNLNEIPSGYNNEGTVAYMFQFTNLTPNKPILQSPLNDMATINTNIELAWRDQGDPDSYPNGYRNYETKIRNTTTAWSQIYPWSNENTRVVSLPSPGRYCWTVQSGDGLTPSGWANEACFTIYVKNNLMIDQSSLPDVIRKGQTLTITGWSIQQDTPNGTGIDQIQLYLDTQMGIGNPLGVVEYGLERTDIAILYGERYRYSGFRYHWNTNTVSLGMHELYIYSHSRVTGWQEMNRLIRIAQNTFLPIAQK